MYSQQTQHLPPQHVNPEDLDKVYKICKSKINVDDILLNAKTNTICVDGTSCTKKTSILMTTGHKVTKVQQYNTCYNPDTFFPSMIGYISAGIIENCNATPHYNDRSPLNVLDWYILWHAMDKFVSRFGNVRIDIDTKPEHAEFVNELVDIFDKYRTVYYRKMLNSTITCIALVDSNVDRVDLLRYERSQGSDIERSAWRFYTQMQNIMYTTLYPNTHIDLNWFTDCNTDAVVWGIVTFLNQTLDQMVARPANVLESFFPSCKLPSIRVDYTLRNAQVHVQRAVGRWTCKKLAANILPLDNNGEQQIVPEFQSYVPAHLYVDNVYNPITRERLPPIIPLTRRSLINNDPLGCSDTENDNNTDDNDNDDDDDNDYCMTFTK